MKIVELFSGMRGWSQPWIDQGHETFTVELDTKFTADLHADILDVEALDIPWQPDIVFASPPCTWFTVQNIGRNWTEDHRPKTEAAIQGVRLVEKTLDLIDELQPWYWLVENPRAKLRKLPVMEHLHKDTVSYCQYGHSNMKPTDLWHGLPPNWDAKPLCKYGAPCHVAAPRGSKTGTQGADKALAGLIPYGLAEDIMESVLAAQTAEGFWRYPPAALPGHAQGRMNRISGLRGAPRDTWTEYEILEATDV